MVTVSDREVLARILDYQRAAASPTRAVRARAARLLRASPAAESRYVRDLRGVMKGVHAGVVAAMELPKPEVHTRTNRLDAVKVLPPQTERRLFAYIAKHVGPAFDRMGAAVDRSNEEGNALLGIRPGMVPGANGVLAQAREDNIRLLQRAAQKYVKDVEGVLRDPDNLGLRVEELADLLQERADVSESRAMLIARDQTLKTNAALTQYRHRAVGVSRYRWSTSRDERVRPLHEALEGQTFAYDDPPVTTESGETNNPGEDIQCRCVPLPVFGDFEEPDPEEG
jgi:SPP1 gp7 family putative phage head morphogenesis protein